MFRLAMPVVGLLIALAVPAVVSAGRARRSVHAHAGAAARSAMPRRGQPGDLRHPARRKHPHADWPSPISRAARCTRRTAMCARAPAGMTRKACSWSVTSPNSCVARGRCRPTCRRRSSCIAAHANWRDRLAVPGDFESNSGQTNGAMFDVSAPGYGTILHTAGHDSPQRVHGSVRRIRRRHDRGALRRPHRPDRSGSLNQSGRLLPARLRLVRVGFRFRRRPGRGLS